VDAEGKIEGGPRWERFTIPAMKAFIACTLYIGMKKQPSVKSYWQKRGSFFHCHVISNIFTRERFQAITSCLHLTNPATYVQNQDEPGYDKMGQLRWLLTAIHDAFMREWTLGKYATIDEMMIRYKGSYCPARQYMPKKPQKWGIKVWYLADATSKFVYNFEVYCGKNEDGPELAEPAQSGAGTGAHNVVVNLVRDLDGRGHVVVCDNFFSSIGLFTELATRQIYATGTVRSNRIGLPTELKNVKNWENATQGTLVWKMHRSHGISCIIWKDKRPMFIILTSAPPIQFPCEPVLTIPRRNGVVRDPIQTSPMHLEYTTFIRGVDVADHLQVVASGFPFFTRHYGCQYVHYVHGALQGSTSTSSAYDTLTIPGGVLSRTSPKLGGSK
jgi:hypothetical protein